MKYYLVCLVVFFSLAGLTQPDIDAFNAAKIKLVQGKKRKAIELFENALNFANISGNSELAMACHLELAELKNNIIDYKEALDHYKRFGDLYREQTRLKTESLQDAVVSLSSDIEKSNTIIKAQDESLDSLTNAQIKSQLDIAHLEIEKQKGLILIEAAKNRRNMLLLILGVGFIILMFISRGYNRKRKNNRTLTSMNSEILNEKKKSDELLLNILPESVAKSLKDNGKATPKRYEKATIMFSDFKGFTKFSEQKTPEEIVAILDYYFCGFDDILSQYSIEKIKTIGDAYLCVSGLPDENPNQILDMIACAKDMLDFVDEARFSDKLKGHQGMEIRIGIHCGPLVAGIVGTKKFAYDIWGDSVNIAARMEQSGVPSHINVSEDVYHEASNHYNFIYRGEVEAKNKGKMKMYLVEN